jgi:hypothetical protein
VALPVVNLELTSQSERGANPLLRLMARRPTEIQRRITLASLHSLHGYNVR